MKNKVITVKIFGVPLNIPINRVLAICAGITTVFAIFFLGTGTLFFQKIYCPLKCNCPWSCIRIQLALIPAGTYTIGLSNAKKKLEDSLFPDQHSLLSAELPQYTVALDSFLISKYEITNEIYSCFLSEVNKKVSGKPIINSLPVTRVSWNEAKSFCDWLSEKIELKVDLPSENQWVAAAGSDQIFPWGDVFPASSVCNFNNKYLGPTAEHHQDESAFNVLNMGGNVSEWCRDGISNGKKPVRGGSWKDGAIKVRISMRKEFPPGVKNDNLGFRIIINQIKNGGINYENNCFKQDYGNPVLILN
ncbi:MAG TPA: SUMF1/EgtB/PvdO family nonheme iron enzyme [Bacteroidia bacterium]|nr:SUMF1/EgtB/PvdO family nonheme iron enzyme [Bacteroidia bacterium]